MINDVLPKNPDDATRDAVVLGYLKLTAGNDTAANNVFAGNPAIGTPPMSDAIRNEAYQAVRNVKKVCRIVTNPK